jgi:hypothetical protein
VFEFSASAVWSPGFSRLRVLVFRIIRVVARSVRVSTSTG